MNLRSSLPLLVISSLSLAACDGGNSTGPTPGAKRVLAHNVVFNAANGVRAAAADGEVDPNLKVLATNVEVSNTGNSLASNNLQSALDNELAVDLATTLPGSTWTIKNRSADDTYGTAVGEVTFSADGKMTLTGRFAAAGLVEGSENSFCNIPSDIRYEVLGTSVLYVSAHVKAREGSWAENQVVVPTVASRTRDTIVLVGSGGCGIIGQDRVSILTRKQ